MPFEQERDALAAHALATIERRLAASAPHERDAFQAGLAALDDAARAHEARAFSELDPARQDALLAALDKGELESSWPQGRAWFERLVRWVAEAAYAEPGPARDRSWQAIGYPQPHLARDVARIAFAARPGAEFDALVIGAGVSGSIVSGVLARAASARCSSGATTRAPAPCNPTSSKTSASRITAHQITAHEITVSLPPATPSWFVSCSRALSSRGVRLPPRSC